MQPQSPDPKFDFMLKNSPQPKRRLSLPGLSGPLKIIVALAVVGVLIIVLSSVLFGHKGGATKQITSALARGQETLRITQLVQGQLRLQDPTVQAAAATAYTTLASDQKQLLNYLAKSHVKLSKTQLSADTNKSTDASLQSASQNNSLDSAYETYLKNSLQQYRADLQTAYSAAGPNGKAILKTAYDSAGTLLANPPLK